MVYDIDSALDKNNYDPIHYINGNGHWETLTGYLGPKTDKKNRNNNLDQHITKSITEQIPCLKGAARNVTSGEDCSDLLFSDDMFK